MIEMRPARPEEIPRQKELWRLAFGDGEAYIDYFYAHAEAQVLVLLEDGAVQTMTALYPVSVSLPGGGRASSAYIYALATHPEARQKGFGRFLLRYVDFHLKERGIDCVTIVPAEPSLHRFFAAAGFSECFATRKVELLPDMLAPPAPGDALSPVPPAEYDALREELLGGSLHVSYGPGLIAYQQGLSRMAGGDLYRLRVGEETGVAAAERPDGETLLVKELIVPRRAMDRAAALLAAALPARRYHLRTPPFWEGMAGSYLQAFAMVKWYRPELEKAWRDERRGYMGLGFD